MRRQTRPARARNGSRFLLAGGTLALVVGAGLALGSFRSGKGSGGASDPAPRRAAPSTSWLDGNAPATLEIPAIGVRAAVEPLGIKPTGAVQTPSEYDRVGWFAGGRPPGEVGSAVLLGHIDSTTGPAVFFRLAELAAGDEVVVRRVDGAVVRFEVDSVHRVRRSSFPTAEVYGPSPDSTLRLVTCAGPWKDGYRDNLIVAAKRLTST